MEEETTEVVTDALDNIPGIGPARKAALYAAGITTRAGLAQASVEQIISLTGMPRTQAEKALEALHATDAPVLSAPSPQAEPPLQDEAMPEAPAPSALTNVEPTGTPVLPDDDHAPATAARGLLDNAAFRAKTSLSDATRVWDLPKLIKPLTKLAAALDAVTEQAANTLRPKAAKRLQVRLEEFSAWVEKAVTNKQPLSGKRRNQIRERLKCERIEIEKMVYAVVKPKRNLKIKAAKDASREPKRRQKRIKK
jgi:hypothetical protein